MAVQPDNEAAIAFLEKWCPGGPWTVTSIAPNQQKIQTRSFTSKSVDGLLAWLEDANGTANIYFLVNPTIEPMNKKAAERDLSELCWLHVDVDPRAGEDFAEERERILAMIKSPPKGIPDPTVVIDSGGGYQLFWRLKDPAPLDGDLEKIVQLKLYNKQLEILLGGDNCFSLDHIMRLPGTVNLPNKRKVAKGRVKAMASVVRFGDQKYSLGQFQSAPPPTSTGLREEVLTKPIKGVRVKDMDELDTHAKSEIPPWCKVLIVQGHDPDNLKKYSSRSEALFAVCCELTRRDVPDEVIYGIITDPDYLISESVREKKAQADQYAKKQIKSAKEQAVDPMLRELNEKHAVIADMGGKCRIISEVYDQGLNRGRISRQSFDDFRNRYSNRFVGIEGKKRMAAGRWWIQHPMRRQYEAVVFAPGKEMNGVYNLWQGFAVQAVSGDCDLYLDHVRENICRGSEKHYDYLLHWMARAVQKPDSAGETAVVLKGSQGTGKSFYAKIFGSLFGRHFVPVSDSKHMVGNFNAHLRDCVLLFGDEAFYAGDVRHESILKMLVTEELMMTELKGVDPEVTPNYTHIILASNKEWVIPAGSNERRFFVLDVGEGKVQDKPYFRKIKDQMDSGGCEALLYHLMNLDISEFDVRTAPVTSALQEQKIMSLPSISEWWLTKLMDGQIVNGHLNWEDSIYRDSLLKNYLEYTRDIGINRRANATAMGKFLHRVCPSGFPRAYQKRTKSGRPYFYEFPPLEECRESYADAELGGKHEWPDPEKLAEDSAKREAPAPDDDEEVPF